MPTINETRLARGLSRPLADSMTRQAGKHRHQVLRGMAHGIGACHRDGAGIVWNQSGIDRRGHRFGQGQENRLKPCFRKPPHRP